MAYVSKQWLRTWQFDENGDQFNDRVGRIILKKCAQNTQRPNTAPTQTNHTKKNSNENYQQQQSIEYNPDKGIKNNNYSNQFERSKQKQTGQFDNTISWADRTKKTPQQNIQFNSLNQLDQTQQKQIEQVKNKISQNHAWVDRTGNLVQNSIQLETQKSIRSQRGNFDDFDEGGIPYCQKTMNLWKRVNPGCMPQYSQTPISTTEDHFQYHSELLDKKDYRHHLQKTDFSVYNEIALKFMNHLVT
eukprot:TRINITY_DN26458_c1_g2_i2.p2 TRINITY_DN26458_c1_g2~~TRINITY_DN26458_c1_g2_i2.p2  ORF type:complete len:245 (+),score=19.54 TRINITY_DN26458_c1_g2_i2:313-1047(+)